MSKIDEKIAKLSPQRDVTIKQIQRVQSFVESNKESATIEELSVRLEALEKAFNSFNISQAQLEILSPEEMTSNTREESEELYYKLKPTLKALISNLNIKTEANTSKKPIESNFVKLKKM